MKSPNDDDDDDEEEEEEVIVFANFEEGTVERDVFQKPDLKFKIIGLESDTPIVQLGETTFKGTWNDTIGTKLFFDEDPTPEQVDPVFTVLPQKMFKYKCMSTKTLDLSRIFLKVKKEGNMDSTIENLKGDHEKPVVPGEEEQQILELAQCTIKPDLDAEEIMKDIIDESTMDIDTEDNIIDNRENP